jgi:NAD-dependent dihydropyrimidine dehydrogenase PreA subunit
MTYVVAEPCIGTKDRACVDVCPVACFYEGADQLYIHPEECIDCAACEPVCPVDAIFTEADTPEQWKSYIQKQVDFFAANPGVTPAKGNAEIGAGGMGANAVPWPPEAAVEASMAAGPAAAVAPAPKVEPKPAAPTPAPAPAAAAPAPAVAARPPAAAAVPAAPRMALPRVAPGEVTGLEGAIALVVEAAASAAAAAAQAAEAAAAVLRALTGQAVAAPPAAPKTEAKPAEQPDRPKPAPQAQPAAKAAAPAAKSAAEAAAATSAGPNTFTQGKLVLYTLVDILSGKIPADRGELARAEQVALALQEEIARVLGKSTFDIRELEKKDITLRQKLELSNGILDSIAKVELQKQVKAQQARAKESLPGGLFAFAMAGLSAALGMLYAFKFVFLDPNPTLQDLLQAPFRPEAIMPFVGFNTVAALILPFGLYALWKVRLAYLEAEAMAALMPREFGANSLKAKGRKKLEQLQSQRVAQVKKLLQEITAKKK